VSQTSPLTPLPQQKNDGNDTSAVVAGRAVTGLAIGASAIAVPAYLGEIAPTAHRGAVVQCYEVCCCFVLVQGFFGSGEEGRRQWLCCASAHAFLLNTAVLLKPIPLI
jgi:MFS family permease